MFVIVMVCVYKAKKRSRRTLCRNLERQYEAVNEPIYEMVLNKNSKPGELSDFKTYCNEAYQKTLYIKDHPGI